MKNITKEEAKKLYQMGFEFGVSLHKSHTKHPHYYVVEDTRVLQELEKIRNYNKT